MQWIYAKEECRTQHKMSKPEDLSEFRRSLTLTNLLPDRNSRRGVTLVKAVEDCDWSALPLYAFPGSEASRTARLRPIPEEHPVISTTFFSMAPDSLAGFCSTGQSLCKRRLRKRRVGKKKYFQCFHIFLLPQGRLMPKHLLAISHLESSRAFLMPLTLYFFILPIVNVGNGPDFFLTELYL